MNADILVLLLDDDTQLLEALAEVLQDAGYRVTAIAESGRAVDVSLEQDFDLVITDIRMAGLDGLEALARVRQIQPDVRSLVITGYSNEGDTIRALRLGVSEYLSKPFRMEQFLEAADRLAQQIRQQRVHSNLEISQRQLLIWCLERYSSDPLVHEQCAWVLAAGRKARDLAVALQLGEGGGQSVQLACLCSLLERHHLPDFVTATLPQRVQAILQAEQGLEHSIIEAAQELAQDHPLDERCSPAIRAAAERLQAGLAPPPPAPAQQRRTTLSLAAALEGGGELDAAIRAYESLLGFTSRESVMAALSLARLNHRHGQAARQYALQAVAMSRNLGPLSLANTVCEAGILLASLDALEAAQLLEEANELCGRLHFPGRQAQVQLALAQLRKQAIAYPALEILLQSRSQEELSQSVWWLAPVLLEAYCRGKSSPDEGALLARSLQRMLTEKPSAIAQLVSGGTLSSLARLSLIELDPARTVLELLAADIDAAVSTAASRKLSAGVVRKLPPLLRIFSLGAQEIYYGEDQISETVFKKNQKARHMLTFLALDRGRQVSEELLGEYFWPDEGSRGRKNIYSLRTIWRRALQPPGFDEEVEYVVRTAGGLMLNPEFSWWHDLEELRRCLRSWEALEKSQRHSDALATLRRAVQLYRGPFLESCYLDWAVSIREQTEYQMMQALLRLGRLVMDLHLAQAGSQRGESLLCSEAQEVCLRVLEIDACSQEAYRLSMQAFIESGRPHDAIRIYERCVKVLKREMNLEPGIPLLEVYTRARLML